MQMLRIHKNNVSSILILLVLTSNHLTSFRGMQFLLHSYDNTTINQCGIINISIRYEYAIVLKFNATFYDSCLHN